MQAQSIVQPSFLVDSFRRSLRAQNKSPATIYTYSSAVDQFIAYLEQMGMPLAPDSISREHIESFVVDLLNRRTPATANNRYRGLQAYFKWLTEDGEITQSPMANMQPPKIPEKAPPVFGDEEIGRLFKACEGKLFVDRRDTAIIRLLLDTGLRRAELAGVRVEDLDLDRQLLEVVGKGGRTRTVAFGRKAARDIDRYLRLRDRRDEIEALGFDDCDGDIAIKLRVVREVHPLAAALSEKSLHGVAAIGERRRQRG